jgi:dTDP-4-dehydrorhamnose 3,5-epimerase-like enzyme
MFKRKKGAVSGRHYHKGKHPSKNPERFFVLYGKMKLYAKDLKTGQETEQVIAPFTEIQISPNIYHELLALGDSIFLEFKNEPYGYDDDVFKL